MKAEVKIPRGHRRLRKGEIIRKGDMWFDPTDFEWAPYDVSIGKRVTESFYPNIRPLKKKGKT